MKIIGKTYNLYHKVKDFCNLLKEHGFKVKNYLKDEGNPEEEAVRILSPKSELALGEIFDNRILVIYNRSNKRFYNESQILKGEAIKLEGLVKTFEVN